jgi:hypothetical protein
MRSRSASRAPPARDGTLASSPAGVAASRCHVRGCNFESRQRHRTQARDACGPAGATPAFRRYAAVRLFVVDAHESSTAAADAENTE